uniref:Uncharacterized protein n=1 Tax=viral metagenome TaxID=1070528 RepID=A0A6M3K696_9ZZZZ
MADSVVSQQTPGIDPKDLWAYRSWLRDKIGFFAKFPENWESTISPTYKEWYKLGKPKEYSDVSISGKEGSWSQGFAPGEGYVGAAPPPAPKSPVEKADQENAAYAMYVSMGGTMTRGEWNTGGKPTSVTNEGLTDFPTPKGFYATYEEANAASPEGYIPIQTPDGWWGLEWQDPTKQPGYVSAGEQQRLGLEEQQLEWMKMQEQGRQAAEKEQRLATLRANPASWLEYASLAQQTPAVQPWMSELAPQTGNWQAGSALPGYSPTGTNMNLQELTDPSAQYWSRMAPSSRQQYGGYEQARTGATPEDVDWKQWQGAPPTGSFQGLTRLR